MKEFIDDGNNYVGYIAETPGVHPAVLFHYRALSTRDKARMDSKRRALDIDFTMDPGDRGEKAEEFRAHMLAMQIYEWNYLDRRGVIFPITQEVMIDRINTSVYMRLYGIIMSVQPSDPMPDGLLVEAYDAAEQGKN